MYRKHFPPGKCLDATLRCLRRWKSVASRTRQDSRPKTNDDVIYTRDAMPSVRCVSAIPCISILCHAFSVTTLCSNIARKWASGVHFSFSFSACVYYHSRVKRRGNEHRRRMRDDLFNTTAKRRYVTVILMVIPLTHKHYFLLRRDTFFLCTSWRENHFCIDELYPAIERIK